MPVGPSEHHDVDSSSTEFFVSQPFTEPFYIEHYYCYCYHIESGRCSITEGDPFTTESPWSHNWICDRFINVSRLFNYLSVCFAEAKGFSVARSQYEYQGYVTFRETNSLI